MQEETAILIIILIIVFLIFFIMVMLCMRLVLYKIQNNDTDYERGTLTKTYDAGQTLTKEQGEALFALRDYREQLRSPLVVSRSRDGEPLDTGRLNALQNDTYYQLLKWAKRLKDSREYGDSDVVSEQLVREMEERAVNLPLGEADKRRFWELAQLPDEIVVPYDTRQSARNERTTSKEESSNKRINFVDRPDI